MGEEGLHEWYTECVRFSGNHPACEKLFNHLRPLFKRIALRVARQFQSLADADDIVQEISLKLVSSGSSIAAALPPEPEQATAYFSVIAANTARDFFRARNCAKRDAKATVSLESLLALDPGAPDSTDKELLMNQIEECLPADRREQVVFRLYYRQGFSAREIAAIPAMELTVKGVESLIHRTTAEIRGRLGPGGGSEKKGASR